MSYGSDMSFPFYTDLDGSPLEGSIWFGVAGQNPVTNPVTVYWDSAGTQPAAQPVTISKGRTVRSDGTPCRVWVASDFSALVQNKLGAQVLFEPNQPVTIAALSAITQATAQAGIATTQAGIATTQAGVATAQAVLAQGYAAAAASSAKFFNTIALGNAGVADAATFGVIAGGSDALPRPTVYRRESAGVSTKLYEVIGGTEFDDAWHERLAASQARYFNERRTRSRDTTRPKALVVVLLGQSNNTPGINTPAVSGTPSANAYMPVGGTALGYFQYYGSDASTACNWTDVASAVQYVETTSEGPGAGMIAALEGVFPRMYVCSAALGGVNILLLAGQGYRSNLYALTHKMCDHARSAGYEPVVAFTSVHGEANMSSFGLLSETDYYTYALDYYRMAQRVAAQAMDQPEYVAPIVFFTPAQMQNGDASRGIVNAVVRISRDIPNGILAGSINQWGMNADQIHNGPSAGERERGEYAGILLRNFFVKGSRLGAPKPVNAVRAGATVTVTFDDEVAQRNTILFGTNLNAALAYLGVEYDDAGSVIKINSATFSGRTIAFVLNSAPVGAADSQYVRFGMQTTVNGAHPANTAGCLIAAANDAGEVSIYDGTVRSYRYVAPFKLAVR